MSKKQKCVPSAELLKSVDKALGSLEKARKSAKQLAKHEKRAISAMLEIEAMIDDAKPCKKGKDAKSKKKKSTKKNNKNTAVKKADFGDHDVVTVTANEIEEPLLALTSLDNTIEAPRNGVADKLHLISGVGPKLEELLHGLGIYHFDQIANWTQSEIDWVDDYLQFSGRIERDNWVEQAKALAIGGRDEYVKVFGKEPR